ncbi:hypothetical protein Btru_050719 [Bulinus truncatus]|nr:hypothetical protein Btru_050719 [Bulinus truncatus]
MGAAFSETAPCATDVSTVSEEGTAYPLEANGDIDESNRLHPCDKEREGVCVRVVAMHTAKAAMCTARAARYAARAASETDEHINSLMLDKIMICFRLAEISSDSEGPEEQLLPWQNMRPEAFIAKPMSFHSDNYSQLIVVDVCSNRFLSVVKVVEF